MTADTPPCGHPAEPARPSCCSWFYRRDGRKCGPLSAVELQAAVRFGFIRPDDLVRSACSKDWVRAKTVSGLPWTAR
ncbi:MAG: DUF4339 domain-containing protein [Planctomycetaceae bacterium]